MAAAPVQAATPAASRKNPLMGAGLDPRLAPPSAYWPAAVAPAPAVTVPAAGPLASLDFELPADLEAAEPPEARGLARDAVRLMVSSLGGSQVVHTRFSRLPDYLQPGDVLAINTSGTLNAALPARRADGTALEVHLSTQLPAGAWTVEVRFPSEAANATFYGASTGETLSLPAGASLTLRAPYHPLDVNRARLWVAELHLPSPLAPYLAQHGFPIRYSYVAQAWPSAYYQTVYATEAGSAEMPSAGRAFTTELVTRLVARGVVFAPLLLHTGVASLEEHEPPYEEYYRVPDASARLINAARRAGQRVLAVGTTVVRALETVAAADGQVHAGEGWTSLVITPDRRLRAVSGLLTGLHEPRASHLHMLAALAGDDHLRLAYAEALRQRYLWHEFGDLHLLLP
jgi:S-adenosylmethionine:tRNA ribosyltransferase-isomerase